MIIAVSGIANTNNNNHYQRKFYQPVNKSDLKENIKQDFGEMLSVEMSKLKIDILI